MTDESPPTLHFPAAAFPANAESTKGRWIAFNRIEPIAGQKTEIWHVVTTRGDDLLGRVIWFWKWRKYVFAPQYGTVYEQDCLRDIAAFVDARTAEQRGMRAARLPDPPPC